MKHFGSIDPGKQQVIIDCWLVVHPGDPRTPAYNRRPGVRVTAGAPKLDRLERAINLRMTLPLALFEAPTLAASIVVDRPHQAVNIDVAAIAEAVRQAIGMDVDLAVRLPEPAQ